MLNSLTITNGLGGGNGDRRLLVFRRSGPSHVGALHNAIRSKFVLLCDGATWGSNSCSVASVFISEHEIYRAHMSEFLA